MNKQAMLIMYHDDYYVLKKLLKLIDSEYFDIYLHVDKKVKKFNYQEIQNIVLKSKITFISSINVKWSTYSQIQCELNLLKEAVKGNYDYYHLISGNDLLIKSNKEIFDFYNKNKGMEFVAYQDFDNITLEHISRIKYYHIFNGNRRHENKIIKFISNKIYYNFLRFQKTLKINRIKDKNIKIRKGANWFSITNDLAKYVISLEKEIRKMYKYSNCADEIFLQTITYNSKFKKNIYFKYLDEHKDIKRYIDWNRGEPYIFTISDYDILINSESFFARKFSSENDKKIIDMIYEKYK